MSFGFLTESALLPSKSKPDYESIHRLSGSRTLTKKPIKVDGRSLVDLKAVIYAKEQKVKLDGGAGGSGGLRGLRGLRGKRSGGARDGNGDGNGVRKDPFARSNRGVEERSQRDEIERVMTSSQKRKAFHRVMAAKSSLYEKMAKGEVAGGASAAGSLVDFTRKSGADLALLEAKAGKRTKKRRTTGSGGQDSVSGSELDGSDDDDDVNLSDDGTGGGCGGGDAKVEILDEFGRHRTVARGGPEHLEHLRAKKTRAAEARAERKRESERRAAAQASSASFDERYSFRGNTGAVPPSSYYGERGSSWPPPPPPTAGGADPSAAWAWSSGTGRGADAGDFDTREGQDRLAAKNMAELLEREGGGRGEGGRGDGSAKILSQWEKTLTEDQKTYLREVQRETEAGRNKAKGSNGGGGVAGLSVRDRQRAERKELLRQKKAAREARLRGEDA